MFGLKKSTFIRLMSLWPPFLGAGIRVSRIDSDFRFIEVKMKLRFWNQNYVGTHFGGSLYAMTDPYYMLMLLENLGRPYIVWDKAATIRFKRPGKGTVRAEFVLTQERIDSIKAALLAQEKRDEIFQVLVKDEQDQVVAEVEKVVYVRRKDSLKTER